MTIENSTFYLIIFIFLIFLIFLFLQFFISNNNNKERIKILLEKQSILEKSLSELIVRNFDRMDSKLDRSSSENVTNLSQIREKMSLIDRAQQNISSLTENVVDLKNFLSNTTFFAFGPIVTLTALATVFNPSSSASRDSLEKLNCFGILFKTFLLF